MAGRDETFMTLALELARRGRGAVEPNPMVGAVIVRDGVELARGWHRRFGGPHAEVDALAAARAAGADVRGATMYVTLEPCRHHGKTPPCTQAIISAGLARVVAAMADPDERVAGGGLAELAAAGLDVQCPLLEHQARELLRGYISLRTRRRPWVICKWAQTLDGAIALPSGQGRWISGEQSRRLVHEIRSWCDAVAVGIGTVLADDPLLNNRSGAGRQPARVVLDANLRIPPGCQLVRSAGASPVLVATTDQAVQQQPDKAASLAKAGAELLALPAAPGGVDLQALLEDFGRRQWTYLLVEGGAKVLDAFLSAGLGDEVLAFVAPFGCQAPAASCKAPAAHLPHFDAVKLQRRLGLGEPRRQLIGEDALLNWIITPTG